MQSIGSLISRPLLAASGLILAAAPALAQQATQPNPANPGAIAPQGGYGHFGNGGMAGGWGWHYGFHHHFFFHPFLSFLVLLLVAAFVVRLIMRVIFGSRRGYGYWHRYAGHWGHPGFGPPNFAGARALEILQERLARGEIGKEEYEATRKVLLQ